MEALINWVRKLIFIILFTTLLEMFLPDSNLRKYVKVVFGLFIISILLGPLTTILGRDNLSLDYIIPEKIIQDNWEEVKEKGEEMQHANNQVMYDYYLDKVKDRIQEVVNIYCKNHEAVIHVELDEHYRIDKIEILLVDKNINNIEIEPVEIFPGKTQLPSPISKEFLSENEQKIKNILRERLSHIFQLGIEQINVTFKKEGSKS